MQKSTGYGAGISLELTAVVVAVTDDVPRVLTVDEGPCGLPTGDLDLDLDPTLERALRRLVAEGSGIDVGYVEQLYTLGDVRRGPIAGVRLISVSYLALVRETSPGPGAAWRDWYDFLPWEDFREGRPAVLDDVVIPAIEVWIAAEGDQDLREAQRERAAIMFGLDGSPWDVERSLERYELLWEIDLVAEGAGAGSRGVGEAMALDHRRITAQALGRVRGKIRYRPVVFELVPPTFTLTRLQRVVEALSGVRLHTQNFRRLLERGGLVEGTDAYDSRTGGRPAVLHRFRREVSRERPAPGVGLPGLRTSG